MRFEHDADPVVDHVTEFLPACSQFEGDLCQFHGIDFGHMACLADAHLSAVEGRIEQAESGEQCGFRLEQGGIRALSDAHLLELGEGAAVMKRIEDHDRPFFSVFC